ncbi:HR-like lesion-inducer [Parasponia andersonii]|uniref:HR-like lesion-inducer n=1 Tax=Parasponia andersonii TaxID=3476 RepID=A0A2P5CNH4_PARAD|nr:HR-like lesion-inducer [Parasponia andersonii]
MGFGSFVGRVLFASAFILSAFLEFNEYGIDGGHVAMVLKPKIEVFIHRLYPHVSVHMPDIEVKQVIVVAIGLKGIGGILFIFGGSLGAYLLLLHQLIATPILYNFYDYDSEEKEFTQLFIKFKEFTQLFIKFTQNVALVGALLFFIGMKNSVPKRQHKTKTF